MKPLQAVATLVDLDKGSVPEVAVVILGFIDPDGSEGFKYHIIGDPNLATTVGLMAIVQNDLLSRVE